MLKRSIAALATAAILSGGACARGGSIEPKVRQDEIPLEVSIELRGGREISIKERTVKTRVVVLGGVGNDVQPTFGVQPLEPVREGAISVLPGVAVIPYKGEGSYTIEAGSPTDLLRDGPTAKPSSSVKVEWLADSGEAFEYVRRAKPCTVEVKDNGDSGRLQCPDLTSDASDGAHFSLDFRWKRP